MLLSQAPHWWFASGTTLRRRSKCCTDAAPPQRLPSVWASQQRSLDCHARILTLSVVPPEHVWLRDGPVVVAACKKGEVWLATRCVATAGSEGASVEWETVNRRVAEEALPVNVLAVGSQRALVYHAGCVRGPAFHPRSWTHARLFLHAAAGRCASFCHSIRPYTRQSLTCMSRRGGVRDWIAVCVRWLRVSCRGCHRSANVPPAELHRRFTMWRLACRHLRWLFIKTARCGRNHRSHMKPSKCMLLLLRAPLPLYHSLYCDTLVLSALSVEQFVLPVGPWVAHACRRLMSSIARCVGGSVHARLAGSIRYAPSLRRRALGFPNRDGVCAQKSVGG